MKLGKLKTVIIGSGSWGTALAQVLADNGHKPFLYGRNAEQVFEINTRHQNSKFFPETILNKEIKATNTISCLSKADVVILAVPTKAVEDTCLLINKYLQPNTIIVNVAKGFHPKSGERLSNVIRRCLDESKVSSVVSLVGPSHAEEVVERIMTCITAVSVNRDDAVVIQKMFSNEHFRVYTGGDEIGAEYGAAMKNVIAMASGMLAGLGMGDNTVAALITRSLVEIRAMMMYHGGQEHTAYGLTGLGDLIVTCMSVHSRNYQAGFEIGKANSAEGFMESNTKTVEGINSARMIHALSKAANINLPVCESVYQVLFENAKPSQMAQLLMSRELKAE